MQQFLFGKIIKSDISIHMQSTSLLARFQPNLTINKSIKFKGFPITLDFISGITCKPIPFQKGKPISKNLIKFLDSSIPQ